MIVIGGGAAGLTAAGMSALLGAKTALIEQAKLGGECTWTGCIPSKALLHVAHTAHAIRTAEQYGLHVENPQVDFARVMDHVREVRQHVYNDADAPPHLEKLGVEVIRAAASFTDDHTLTLNSAGHTRRITSRFFVIATGSRPKDPHFAVPCWNNESLFEITEQPSRLLVMGGGPVGIEMSQAFQRLGTRVTVVVPGQEILAKDDPQLAALLRQSLVAEGAEFKMGAKVESVTRDGADLVATLNSGERLMADAVLAAIGREPRTRSLELAKAGVAETEKGITVDKFCRTSRPHIFAAGDVTGRYQFTHMAEHMSKVAVTNAILRFPKSLDESRVTWCTFTDPELAQVGQTEVSLQRARVKYQVYEFPFSKLDRAITESRTVGLVKALADPKGRILGASILGARAGEMIAEFALAMCGGLKLGKIAETIHAYPTYALGNRRAADGRANRELDSRLLGLLGKVLRYRGERRGSAAL